MHDMTEGNLHNAFAGESQAHMRYKIYSEIAIEEGYPNVARMFRAISFAERVHASNHLERMPKEEGYFSGKNPYGTGTTSENLQAGIDGETFEIEEMYPTYKKVAEFQEEDTANQSFDWALQAEKIHAKMYKDAKRSVDKGEDVELGKIQICSVCGTPEKAKHRNNALFVEPKRKNSKGSLKYARWHQFRIFEEIQK